MTSSRPAVSGEFGDASEAAWLTRRQKFASFARAPSRPPSIIPAASRTALTAPALDPLTASNAIPGSSSKRSRTPQVKAPNDPPPWSASESFSGGQGAGRGAGGSLRVFIAAGVRSTA